MSNLDLTADMLDVRDIIARLEELREDRDDFSGTETFIEGPEGWAGKYPEDADELATLEAILDDLKGNGGDEQWEGSWYPVTLIRDSYFIEYAQELAEDIGCYTQKATAWPHSCIDWEKAARELQYDYSSVEINDITYWYR
jgi:hypothetical protein